MSLATDIMEHGGPVESNKKVVIMDTPNVGKDVIESMNKLILNSTSDTGCSTRCDVAKWILTTKPGWYTQTPEGEYLHWVAFGGEQD